MLNKKTKLDLLPGHGGGGVGGYELVVGGVDLVMISPSALVTASPSSSRIETRSRNGSKIEKR